MKSQYLASLAKAICLSLWAGALIAPAPAGAQESTPAMTIELNAIAPTETGCRLTFLARNSMEVDLEGLVLEAVLFSQSGSVDQLTLLDFQALPSGRPRVRQFDMPGAGCTAISGVLINGVASCTAEGLSPDQCLSVMQFSSRTEIEVMG